MNLDRSEFYQIHNPRTGYWVKFRRSTSEQLEMQPERYKDLPEIEWPSRAKK